MKQLVFFLQIALSWVGIHPPLPPEATTIQLANVTHSVEIVGRVYSLSRQTITAPFEARVRELRVRLGQTVKKGDPLIFLDFENVEDDLRDGRLQMTRDLNRMRTNDVQIKKIESEISRFKEGVQLRVVASSQLEDSRFRLKTLQAENETLQESIALEQKNLNEIQDKIRGGSLRAPIDGTVIDTWVNSSDFLTGQRVSVGDALVTIASVGVMKVKSLAPEFLTAQLNEFHPVQIHLPTKPDELWKGKVVSIRPPSVKDEDTAGTFEVTAEFSPGARQIRNGLEAIVDAVIESKQNTSSLPKSAVRLENGKAYVAVYMPEPESSSKTLSHIFFPPKNRIAKTPVETGLIGDDRIEIVSGLNREQQVLVRYDESN